jgi:hypothetical protein
MVRRGEGLAENGGLGKSFRFRLDGSSFLWNFGTCIVFLDDLVCTFRIYRYLNMLRRQA